MTILKFPNHAKERMTERGIDIDHMKEAINNPDKKKLQKEGRICVTKKIGNKTIEVVYCKEEFKDRKNQFLIITAYYLD